MSKFFSELDNQTGFVFFNNKKWNIITSTHACERAEQRGVNADKLNLAVAMLADQLDAAPYMRDMVLTISGKGHNIFFRDDVNDIAVAIHFDLRERFIKLITCWNQAEDRQKLCRAHTALKKGFNILADSRQVRLIRRYEDGSRSTISRAENWEISRIDEIENYKPAI